MKHLLLAILVLLLPLLLVPRVQGIRLGMSVANSVENVEGKNRKLLITATPTTTTTATASTTNQKAHEQNTERNEAASKGIAKEGFSVKSSKSNLEHYPDIIDIVEMDYSPAKRKPPIHN